MLINNDILANFKAINMQGFIDANVYNIPTDYILKKNDAVLKKLFD